MIENRVMESHRRTVIRDHLLRQIPAAALAALAASVLMLSSSPADAQTPAWSVWEKWEGSTTPVSGGSTGVTNMINGAGANSPTHYLLVGTTGPTWWSVGRTFKPPAGLECFAYAVRAGAGTFTSLTGALEVIDSDTWAYIRNKPFTVLRDQAWTWINTTGSTGWTSDGGNIFVRMVINGSTHGSNVHFDDIVVQCY